MSDQQQTAPEETLSIHKKSVTPAFFYGQTITNRKKLVQTPCLAGQRVRMGQVIGVVLDVKVLEGIDAKTQQPFTSKSLVGSFEMVSDLTGEVATTAVFYAPPYYIDEIEAHLKRSPSNLGLRFAIDLYAEPTDRTPVGYSFTCNPLVERAADDPLDEMKRAMQKRGLLRLPPAPVAALSHDKKSVIDADAPDAEEVAAAQAEAAEAAPVAKGRGKTA